MASTILENISEGLRILYQQRDLEYDDLFKTRCEENGLDDDEALEEELAGEYTETQLIDDEMIDGLCEWIDYDGDTERRQAEIFDIFVKLSKNPNYFDNVHNARAFRDSVDWSLNEKDVTNSDQKIKEQAKAIYAKMKGHGGGHGNDEEAVLRNMLAVANKDGSNYFQCLVDMFLRERVDHFYRNRDNDAMPLEVNEWAKNNKHMKLLGEKKTHWPGQGGQTTRAFAAITAVTSYLKRVAPKLMLPPSQRIKGDLLSTAMYIEQAAKFVQSNSLAGEQTCPFQYDAVIVFNELENVVDSASGSEEEWDEENKDPDEMDDPAALMSQMGNVKQRLATSKLKHVALEMNVRTTYRTPEAYDKLKNQMKGKFPRHNRFCSILDFRGEQQDGNPPKGRDNFFVFEADEDHKKVYPNASTLNYFNNGFTIIPSPNEDEEALGSLSSGPQIVLSFHVDDTDSIRCYIFIFGQWTRFQAKDLLLILPFFLEDSPRNQGVAKGKEIREIIARLEGIIKDKTFDSFLKRNEVRCPLKDENKK